MQPYLPFRRAARALSPLVLSLAAAVATAETVHYPASLADMPTARIPYPAGAAGTVLQSTHSISRPRAEMWRMEEKLSETYNLPIDPTPDNPLDLGNAGGSRIVGWALTEPGGAQHWFADVYLQGGALPDPETRFEVLVVVDKNGDNRITGDEVLCHARNTGITAHCRVDLRAFPARNLNILTRLHSHTQSTFPLVMTARTARFASSGGVVRAMATLPADTRVVLPDAITAHTPFSATFHHYSRLGQYPETRFGGVLITDQSQSSATAQVVPMNFSIEEVAPVGRPFAMAAGRLLPQLLTAQTAVTLQPGESHPQLYVDNSDQDYLVVQASTLEGVDVHVWRDLLPQSAVDSTRIQAPTGDHLVTVLRKGMSSSDGGPNSTSICSVHCEISRGVGAGRYFITPVNTSDRPVMVRLGVSLRRTLGADPGTGLGVPSGNYYNPLRSGDGVFIDTVDGTPNGVFYTFDEAGLPTWYSLSGTSPLRFVWQGTIYDQANGTRAVGRFSMVKDALKDELVFSWSIGDTSGSNRLVLAARSGCAGVNGVPAQVSGHWYAPDSPGWGMNVQGLGDTTVLGAYFYDAARKPRWAIGTSNDAGSTKTFALHQVTGACPTCAYVAPTVTPVGQWGVDFASATDARSRPSITFVAPLSGQFAQQQAVVRATSPVACQ
ncbi:hypothetical protein [Tahibacter amnicola]|uniref:EF-hand domain-containing protein n=1 Tax=Tahibacter amnicola TaxID=2976241 RepID=A0ABY6BEI7_9GAMM|nr:hypothetical protein [Tahibacter amnicola]UXI67031.1 hypothetical protein N4264_20095 [Tahibacter amnicola]